MVLWNSSRLMLWHACARDHRTVQQHCVFKSSHRPNLSSREAEKSCAAAVFFQEIIKKGTLYREEDATKSKGHRY